VLKKWAEVPQGTSSWIKKGRLKQIWQLSVWATGEAWVPACNHLTCRRMKGEGRMGARDPSSSAGMKKRVTRLRQTSRKQVLREHGTSRRNGSW